MMTALIDFATCALSVASSVGFKVILHVVLPLLIEVPSFGVGASSLASFVAPLVPLHLQLHHRGS